MTLLKFLGRGLLLLVAVTILAVATLGLADFTALRNLVQGPAMGRVDQTERNQPQEAVPAGPVDDLPLEEPSTIAARALATAEAYAAKTESVALLVYHRGALRYEKYFPGYGPDFRTDSFSGHKTVMGLLVGAAIADGYIGSVDDPAAKYLPEFARDSRKAIRIRDLLQMASGLEVPRFPGLTSIRLIAGQDLTTTALSLPLEKPPGSDFQYSNVNAELLGIVIQRASGTRYADYLSSRLWSRIGAPAAAVWLDRTGGMPRTFCCIYTSARGWLQVGRLILNKGRYGSNQVLPESWIAAMTTPSPNNSNYGYQIWLGSPPGRERRYNDKTIKAFHSEPFAAPDMIYIDGFGGQRVYIVPSQDLIVVRTGKALQAWDDALLPNAILRGIKPENIGGTP
jgi:CubicO group peptidase (beta-lactamase class C family)